jgi:hypothetical protein
MTTIGPDYIATVLSSSDRVKRKQVRDMEALLSHDQPLLGATAARATYARPADFDDDEEADEALARQIIQTRSVACPRRREMWAS